MTAINYKDPRFQKAMLQAHANPIKNAAGISEQLTGAFTTQQLGVQSQFNTIARNKDRFESGMKFANKRLRSQKNIFRRELSDARSANKIGLYGGVGTSMVAALIGMSNKKKLESEAASLRKFRTTQMKKIDAQTELLNSLGGIN